MTVETDIVLSAMTLGDLKVLIPCWLLGMAAGALLSVAITVGLAVPQPWQFPVGMICGGAGVNAGNLAAFFILSRRERQSDK